MPVPVDMHLEIQISDELSLRYIQLNRWLQVQCYWYHVLSNPQFSNESYDRIYEETVEMERDDVFGEYQVPRRDRWNYLPDRYDPVVLSYFEGVPQNRRYPWIVGEGEYRGHPVCFDVKPKTSILGAKGVSKMRLKGSK